MFRHEPETKDYLFGAVTELHHYCEWPEFRVLAAAAGTRDSEFPLSWRAQGGPRADRGQRAALTASLPGRPVQPPRKSPSRVPCNHLLASRPMPPSLVPPAWLREDAASVTQATSRGHTLRPHPLPLTPLMLVEPQASGKEGDQHPAPSHFWVESGSSLSAVPTCSYSSRASSS